MEKKSYFTIKELCHSDTAKAKGIKNEPTATVKKHLQELIPTLDSMREWWDAPITVTSGYRCPELNKAVGGTSTSVHTKGYAADLVPANGEFDEFMESILRWAMMSGCQFDQLLIEVDKKGSRWIHIGLYNNKGQQRMQVYSLEKK